MLKFSIKKRHPKPSRLLKEERLQSTISSAAKKTSFGERSGADSNNSSSKGLQQGGSERLSSRPHTHQVDAAKVAENTEKTKRSAMKLINAGGLMMKM